MLYMSLFSNQHRADTVACVLNSELLAASTESQAGDLARSACYALHSLSTLAAHIWLELAMQHTCCT